MEEAGREGEGMIFRDMDEAVTAWRNGYVHLHSRIAVNPNTLGDKPFTEEQKSKLMVTTVGKIIFNSIMPQEFPYLNEPSSFNLTVQTPDKYFVAPGTDIKALIAGQELVAPFKKKDLGSIIAEVFIRNQTTTESTRNIVDLFVGIFNNIMFFV